MECPPSLTNHYSPHSLTHSLTSHYSPQILAHSLTPFSSRSQACHHFSVCLGIRAAYSFLSFTKTKKRPLPQLCSLKPEQRNSRFSPKPSLETTTVVVRSHSERYHSLPWNLPEYARKPLFQKKCIMPFDTRWGISGRVGRESGCSKKTPFEICTFFNITSYIYECLGKIPYCDTISGIKFITKWKLITDLFGFKERWCHHQAQPYGVSEMKIMWVQETTNGLSHYSFSPLSTPNVT